MADQTSVLKITAVDNTASALKSAADSIRKLSADAGKAFAPATAAAEAHAKVVAGAARRAGVSVEEFNRRTADTKKRFDEIARAAPREF
jgi:hypothetical protein